MKSFLLLLFFGAVSSATAQQSTYSTTQSQINDDDKTLSIQIDGQRNGQPVKYNRSFNVAGLSKPQKEALKNRVLDSLGLGDSPPAPETPRPPMGNDVQSSITFTCPTCTGKSKLMISGDGISITQESEGGKSKLFPLRQALRPGNYRYTYWQNGVLQMELPFSVKAGESNDVKVK
jgi:hypothetical protein